MKSLVGDYSEEHLFTLRQSLKAYRYYQELIQEVDAQVKQILLTEIGPNRDRYPTGAAFCSWLRQCPDPKISGGRVLSSRSCKPRRSALSFSPIAAPKTMPTEARV